MMSQSPNDMGIPKDMRIVPMPRDNHCGYHGILYGLKMLSHPMIDPFQSTKENILMLKSILIKEYEKRQNPRARELETHENEWLDDQDMGILANYFHICIDIFDERMHDIRVTNIGPDECTDTITMIQRPNHFDILVPTRTEIEEVLPTNVFITKSDISNTLKKNVEEDESVTDDEEYELEDEPTSFEYDKFKSTRPSYVDIVKRKDRMSNEDVNSILEKEIHEKIFPCLLYTSPSPRDKRQSRMPSSA